MIEERSESSESDEPERDDAEAEGLTAAGRERADDVGEKLKQEEDAAE
jgi:hypothetical protein